MKEVAFYYPGPVWERGDEIKNLLLFFDGVALLVPEYLREKPFLVDPAIAYGLREKGLLFVLEPETFIDKETARRLGSAVTDILASGRLDPLLKSPGAFAELSMSRLGYMADETVAAAVFRELEERGLARETKDGKSIPMHPMVRNLILTLLAQLLRPLGLTKGLDLMPATDRPRLVEALAEVLSVEPGVAQVAQADLQEVSLDLSAIPIDEILGFREAHGSEFRKYARDLRRFVMELATVPVDERNSALGDRREEIRDQRDELKKVSRAAWGPRVRFALGLVGSGVSVATGNVLGAALTAASTIIGAVGAKPKVEAFSYIFAAEKTFSARK
jgi:hypothetical protein